MIVFNNPDELTAFLEGQDTPECDPQPAPDPVLVYLSAVEAASHRLASDLQMGMSKLRDALTNYTAAVRNQEAPALEAGETDGQEPKD